MKSALKKLDFIMAEKILLSVRKELFEDRICIYNAPVWIRYSVVSIFTFRISQSSGSSGSLNLLAFYLALFSFTSYTIFWAVRLYSSFSPEALQQLTKG